MSRGNFQCHRNPRVTMYVHVSCTYKHELVILLLAVDSCLMFASQDKLINALFQEAHSKFYVEDEPV